MFILPARKTFFLCFIHINQISNRSNPTNKDLDTKITAKEKRFSQFKRREPYGKEEMAANRRPRYHL
jgi:hypothetical protein